MRIDGKDEIERIVEQLSSGDKFVLNLAETLGLECWVPSDSEDAISGRIERDFPAVPAGLEGTIFCLYGNADYSFENGAYRKTETYYFQPDGYAATKSGDSFRIYLGNKFTPFACIAMRVSQRGFVKQDVLGEPEDFMYIFRYAYLSKA